MPQLCAFTNPKTAGTYTFQANPRTDGVAAAQKARQIDRTSNTGNVGLVKQQGDDGPFILHWEIDVHREDMETTLWEWYMLCKAQTIWLTDFNGEQFEGQITTLSRQQVGVLAGPGDDRARRFYCKYILEFEVYRFISGVMASAGVSP